MVRAQVLDVRVCNVMGWLNSHVTPVACVYGLQGDQTTKPAFAGTSVDAMTDAIYERKYELDSLIKYAQGM